jgi:hypothetical protein
VILRVVDRWAITEGEIVLRIIGPRVVSRVAVACLGAGAIVSFSASSFPASAQSTAPNEWTWVGGSVTFSGPTEPFGPPGAYGTLGTPAAGNIPGGRDSAVTWSDKGGNFWLFGGEGVDANGNYGQLNDLWEFQPSTQQWIWMGGSSALPSSCAGSTTVPCGQPGTYGTLGVAAASNLPGGRSAAAYWTDSNGYLWMFGGFGFDASGTLGELNDLWEFDSSAKEWTWMGGSSTIGNHGGQPGIYGTLGSAAAGNVPGGRYSATFWTDSNGQLWLYGGEGFDSQGNDSNLDDLWRLNPSTAEWTWINGHSTAPSVCESEYEDTSLCGWPPIYGSIGVSAPGIGPGSRIAAAAWAGNGSTVWLFGGEGTAVGQGDDFSTFDQYDLWALDSSTNQWAWMSGIPSSPVVTGADRMASRASWEFPGWPIIRQTGRAQSVGLTVQAISGSLVVHSH